MNPGNPTGTRRFQGYPTQGLATALRSGQIGICPLARPVSGIPPGHPGFRRPTRRRSEVPRLYSLVSEIWNLRGWSGRADGLEDGEAEKGNGLKPSPPPPLAKKKNLDLTFEPSPPHTPPHQPLATVVYGTTEEDIVTLRRLRLHYDNAS